MYAAVVSFFQVIGWKDLSNMRAALCRGRKCLLIVVMVSDADTLPCSTVTAHSSGCLCLFFAHDLTWDTWDVYGAEQDVPVVVQIRFVVTCAAAIPTLRQRVLVRNEPQETRLIHWNKLTWLFVLWSKWNCRNGTCSFPPFCFVFGAWVNNEPHSWPVSVHLSLII